MRTVFLIGFGGFLDTVCRYLTTLIPLRPKYNYVNRCMFLMHAR